MNRNLSGTKRVGSRGFSLLELMLSLVILSAVVGVAMSAMVKMEQRKAVENSKMDLVQESREFIDQVTNDIHQSGFPTVRMFDTSALTASQLGPANCSGYLTVQLTVAGTGYCPPIIALGLSGTNGLISVSQSALQFEADTDGTGVSEVFIQLKQTNGANAAACTSPPCIIQRGVISKSSYLAGNTVLYYTELGDVMNTNVFTAYDNSGTAVSLPATTQATLATISDIGITLYVKSISPDPQTGQYPTATMVSDAKLRLN